MPLEQLGFKCLAQGHIGVSQWIRTRVILFRHIKLIKSDNKAMYNATKYFYFKFCSFKLSILSKNIICIMVSTHTQKK